MTKTQLIAMIKKVYIRIGFLKETESGIIKITDKQKRKILQDTTKGLKIKTKHYRKDE